MLEREPSVRFTGGWNDDKNNAPLGRYFDDIRSRPKFPPSPCQVFFQLGLGDRSNPPVDLLHPLLRPSPRRLQEFPVPQLPPPKGRPTSRDQQLQRFGSGRLCRSSKPPKVRDSHRPPPHQPIGFSRQDGSQRPRGPPPKGLMASRLLCQASRMSFTGELTSCPLAVLHDSPGRTSTDRPLPTERLQAPSVEKEGPNDSTGPPNSWPRKPRSPKRRGGCGKSTCTFCPRHRLQRPTHFQSFLPSAKRASVIGPRLTGVTGPSS